MSYPSGDSARRERVIGLRNTVGTKQTNPKDAVGTKRIPLSVVPSAPLGEVGLAMLEGARKYGRHNYRAVGVRHSTYYDSTFRHLTAWWEGEDIDPDSGLHHLSKAIAGLVVLRDCQIRGNDVDDRPPGYEKGWQALLNEAAGEIVDCYPDACPPVVAKPEKEDDSDG